MEYEDLEPRILRYRSIRTVNTTSSLLAPHLYANQPTPSITIKYQAMNAIYVIQPKPCSLSGIEPIQSIDDPTPKSLLNRLLIHADAPRNLHSPIQYPPFLDRRYRWNQARNDQGLQHIEATPFSSMRIG